jgi:hypothetical protein
MIPLTWQRASNYHQEGRDASGELRASVAKLGGADGYRYAAWIVQAGQVDRLLGLRDTPAQAQALCQTHLDQPTP